MPCPIGADVPQLDFEAWRVSFSASVPARYAVECAEPRAFTGWVRPFNVFGLAAVDVAWNINRLERTQRDARIDGVDIYGVLFQLAGCLMASNNGQTFHLAEGDVVLIDKSRPASYSANGAGARTVYIPCPRWPLISHLGFEPRGGSCKRAGTPAARLLYQFLHNSVEGDESKLSPNDFHMQHAIYSLIGALFVPDTWCGSRQTDKLFARVRDIVRDRLADPDFGPREIAADVGISLRYVHKLFTERGFSCQEFIYSCRLDRAAQLLNCRPGKAQPLSEIARACGFRDYTHFARRFRHRFGRAPGADFERCGSEHNSQSI